MKTGKLIDAALTRLFRGLSFISGIVGALMMVLAVANVIARSVFNRPIFGTVEIISYSALLLGAFALALNELSDGNITMTLLTDSLKPTPKHLFELVTSLLAAAFYAAITFRYAEEVLVTLDKATKTSTVGIPMWCVNAVMAVGFFAAMLALLLKALRCAAYLVYRGAQNQVGGDSV